MPATLPETTYGNHGNTKFITPLDVKSESESGYNPPDVNQLAMSQSRL